MRGRDHRLAVMLTVALALLGTVGTSMHAHSIDEASNDCTACVLGSTAVDQIAPASSVMPAESAPPLVVTPVRVAAMHRAYDVRTPRGPPSA